MSSKYSQMSSKCWHPKIFYPVGRKQRNGNPWEGREAQRKAWQRKTQKALAHREGMGTSNSFSFCHQQLEAEHCSPPHRLDGVKGQPARGAVSACAWAWTHVCAKEVRTAILTFPLHALTNSSFTSGYSYMERLFPSGNKLGLRSWG